MPIRSITAVAGLVLALTLAATGASGKGAGAVVGASEGDTPAVTLALVEPGAEGGHRFVPSPYADQAREVWVPMPLAPEPAPTPAPEPVPAPTPPAAAPGSVTDVINRHFGAAAGRAHAIAQCESRMNPNAVSPTNDHGLFQINIVHRGQFESVTGAPWSSVYDAELNTVYAKWLYDQQGWSPWVCNRKV